MNLISCSSCIRSIFYQMFRTLVQEMWAETNTISWILNYSNKRKCTTNKPNVHDGKSHMNLNAMYCNIRVSICKTQNNWQSVLCESTAKVPFNATNWFRVTMQMLLDDQNKNKERNKTNKHFFLLDAIQIKKIFSYYREI